jgi:hypothetical protein
MAEPSTKKGRGGKRAGAGPPKGRQLKPITIERLRASINSKLAIDTLHEMAQVGGQHDAVRVSAAKVLLSKVLPDLAAVEHTGAGGGPVQFVFEKVDD